MLLRRDKIENFHIRFPEGFAISGDTAFFLQVLCIAKAVCVPETLTYYCRRADSATGQAWTPRRYESSVELFGRVEDFAEQHYPEGMRSFRIMRNFRSYRFVLDCVKKGYIAEAEEYIVRWRPWLEGFAHGGGRLVNRLRCQAMLSANGEALKWIGKL